LPLQRLEVEQLRLGASKLMLIIRVHKSSSELPADREYIYGGMYNEWLTISAQTLASIRKDCKALAGLGKFMGQRLYDHDLNTSRPYRWWLHSSP